MKVFCLLFLAVAVQSGVLKNDRNKLQAQRKELEALYQQFSQQIEKEQSSQRILKNILSNMNSQEKAQGQKTELKPSIQEHT